MVLTDEERKAKARAYASRPENKEKKKQSDSTPEAKAKRLEYGRRPEVKAKKKEYNSTPEAKARVRAYASTPEAKANATKRSTTPEFRAKGRTRHNNKRLKIFQAYSKRLSNSDVACCNCCGIHSHVDFLALDHIFGRVEMDSMPELVAIGYSSKLENNKLKDWIIDNNFPDGFQILCHNCNFAKGYPRNNGKCPHERK